MRAAPARAPTMGDDALLAVLAETAEAVGAALDGVRDRREPGDRPGQYALDLATDEAACGVLHRAGLTVLSEESGLTAPSRTGAPAGAGAGADGDGPDAAAPLLVVVDPVDGSTNASLGLPWYATSLCVVDAEGPRAALVVNLATGARYEAVRGGGARRDGRPIAPSGCTSLATAVVGVSGLPAARPGWAQFRALGAAALDLCAVAEGVLDAYRVAGGTALSVWDYLGAVLVCAEAGAAVDDLDGLDLAVRGTTPRRPVAAATPALLQAVRAAPA